MSVLVVIPARLDSTRLPRKLLKDLGGIPVLRHTWNRVNEMQFPHRVLIATDSEEIREEAEGWGAEVVMTDPECTSGTERIASILGIIQESFVLNVQGDEPFIDPKLLDRLCQCWEETNCDLVTAVYKIKEVENLFNPNCIKVVRSEEGRAIYFSRSPIPYCRDLEEKDWLTQATYWGHVGVYGYSKHVLENYLKVGYCSLEKTEALEQLRFVDSGYNFQTVETENDFISIDTQAGFDKASEYLVRISR